MSLWIGTVVGACAVAQKVHFEPSLRPMVPLASAQEVLQAMSGCFLVDYSYVEVDHYSSEPKKSLQVYDVNRNKAVKEWITFQILADGRRYWLQHVLFATDEQGELLPDFMLKHQAEDWVATPATLFDLTQPNSWQAKSITQEGLWIRKITNLDDGLRYQAVGSWQLNRALPSWQGAGLAPIPGRETRDMGRKDYTLLDRKTELVLFGSHFVERQDNVKVQHQADGKQVQLARELGRNWSIRLPDEDCQVAATYASKRAVVWQILREAWDEVLAQSRQYTDLIVPKESTMPTRYQALLAIEEQALQLDCSNQAVREEVKQAFIACIRAYQVALEAEKS